MTAPQPPGALHHCETENVPCEMNATEWKTHFSAWSITSAPLVLGMDLRDEVMVHRAWPIISNTAVLEVQATWVGDSGRLWARSEETTEVPNCGHGKGCQLPLWLVWTKKQPTTGGGSAAAILLMNNGDTTINVSAPVEGIHGLGSCAPSGCVTRDLWIVSAQEQTRVRGELVRTLEPHDSAMLMVTSDNPAPPPTPPAPPPTPPAPPGPPPAPGPPTKPSSACHWVAGAGLKGGDIEKIAAATKEQCCGACVANPHCKAACWRPQNHTGKGARGCHMKATVDTDPGGAGDRDAIVCIPIDEAHTSLKL